MLEIIQQPSISSKPWVDISPDMLRKTFQNPGVHFRGKGFWAWNDALEESELRRQIGIIKQMGMGGFFMHARVGLKTPYLKSEWFRCVKACCEQARKEGLEAWLYDEDRWPSGFAGGLVTSDPDNCLKRLRLQRIEPKQFKWSPDILSAFVAKIDSSDAYDVQLLKRGRSIPPIDSDYSVLSFSVETAQTSANFNNTSYVDTLSEQAIGKFIEVTHRRYNDELKGELRDIVPGIFTDEPHHGPVCDTNSFWMAPDTDVNSHVEIPWTSQLPENFRKRYGYELLDHLPCLFFNINGVPVNSIRHHYHDCITRMFVESYSMQIGNWCREHNLQFAGHVLHEDPLSMQASYVGSAMRFYEHMDIPGVDTIAPVRHEYTTVKQCSSVAHQLGKKTVMSEMYGGIGWDYPMEGLKAIGDWQAALGVNMRCLHLQWYTMKGQAKRDYPPSIFYQSPWWSDYKMLEDYFARFNLISENSTPVRNVLVIHPNESMWQLLKVGWTEDNACKQFDQSHHNICRWLLESHIDFDYGDEEMISRYGDVDSRKECPRFVVGNASYSAVLVPRLLTIRRTTLDLLTRFSELGGQVVVVDALPDYVDGLKSGQAVQIGQSCVIVEEEKSHIINALLPYQQVSIQTHDGRECESVLYLLAEFENKQKALFVVNSSRTKRFEKLHIRLNTGVHSVSCEKWDLRSGTFHLVGLEPDGDWVNIQASLEAGGSALYVLNHKAQPVSFPRTLLSRCEDNFKHHYALDGNWQITRSEPNTVVLDYCDYKIADGLWHPPQNVLHVDRQIREKMGLDPRSGRMVQPWVRGTQTIKGPSIAMRFYIEVQALPSSPIYAAIEQSEQWQLSLNGCGIDIAPEGYWIDPCLHKVPLDCACMQLGLNVLQIEGQYQSDQGLESIFLLGDFGVHLKETLPVMTQMPTMLNCGDWVRQGFPFYSGAIRYTRKVQLTSTPRCVELVIPKFAGSLVKVFINGVLIDCIGWPPYRVDISRYASKIFELSIEICSHRRNVFGPLHAFGVRPDKPNWVGPDEFTTEKDRWKDSYNLVPCGLMASPYLLIAGLRRIAEF